MNGLEEHMQDCGLEENIINDFKDVFLTGYWSEI